MMCFEALSIYPILHKTKLDLASEVDSGVARQVIPGLPDTQALLSTTTLSLTALVIHLL